ncbi:MAG: hypothetical protein K2X99_06415 [Gemmatimonadaceae bacterium]|nr:hypothetical protein [Gemmatimonadaceae bacterium]
MSNTIRAAVLPLCALVVLACGEKAAPADETRAVELAPAAAPAGGMGDTAVTPPATTEAPAAPAAPTKAAPKPAAAPTSAPAATKPAPAKPAAATSGMIAGGTSFSTALMAKVCTSSHAVGDRVTTTLSEALTGTNGVSVAAGSTVMLEVTQSARGENSKNAAIGFKVVSVEVNGATYTVDGTVSAPAPQIVRAQSTGDQAKKVAAGAAVGALAGKLLGKGTKSTVVGAAVGAAAGGAVAKNTADYNACLDPNTAISITLNGPLTIKK